MTSPDSRDLSGRRPSKRERMLSEITVSVPPHIAALDLTLSPDTVGILEQAAAAVVDLDRGAGRQLGALGGFLLRTESVASSKIEHVFADRDDLALALAGHAAGVDARATAAAVSALTGLIDDGTAGPITTDAVHRAHEILLRGDRQEGSWAGRFRAMQNWIGGSDFTPLGALYVPPPPDLVDRLMEDLVAAANRLDGSAVALAAVVHAQFESIHPFTDGNGRIGRALLNAVLRRRGLTTTTVVPVASVMLADVDHYFRQLDAYRDGDAESFVRYLAGALDVACNESQTSSKRLRDMPDQWRATVAPRRGSGADLLIDHLLSRPVLDARTAEETTGLSTRRVYDALDVLTEADVLREITGGRRDRVWIASDVLDELDDLDRRIGHR
ncbi:MAG: DNA-binding protein, partial [Acidimicrobiales bacterium]|nr:DNA-binding protein [Acidimicrobiales bacterium]